MIIYNVTINIDNDVADEWLQWMQQVHIPDVMNTGCFLENHVLRVMADEDSGGRTYSIQYLCSDMSVYEQYKEAYAPALQAEVNEKYKGRFVAFRTLLEIVS
jgi:hypothetical protein